MDNSKQQNKTRKPRVGITLGDYNGVGPETIIKVMQDKRIMNICTPIIYGSGKILTKYKRLLNIDNFGYHQFNSNSYLNEKKPNVVNCWADPQELLPGRVTEEAGKCAFLSIQRSTEDLKSGFIDAVVTCPINKANIQRDEFRYAGHTEYYAEHFSDAKQDSLMLLCSGNLRVGVITGHIPLMKVSEAVTKELIIKKTMILMNTLKQDFGIAKPKVALLGMNPHAGEEGLLGDEEGKVIGPAITEMKKKGNLVYGPYPSDGFFGTMMYKKFDAVLAMYHDQGLIPFKTLAFDSGVNYTAGLKVVRTSPDHGTAYNIAGKGIANEESLREAIYQACDIVKNRKTKTERKLRSNAKELLDAMKEDSKKVSQEEQEKAEIERLEKAHAREEEAKRKNERQPRRRPSNETQEGRRDTKPPRQETSSTPNKPQRQNVDNVNNESADKDTREKKMENTDSVKSNESTPTKRANWREKRKGFRERQGKRENKPTAIRTEENNKPAENSGLPPRENKPE